MIQQPIFVCNQATYEQKGSGQRCAGNCPPRLANYRRAGLEAASEAESEAPTASQAQNF